MTLAYFEIWKIASSFGTFLSSMRRMSKNYLSQKSQTTWVWMDEIKIIKDECVLICEYHLENAVRLLREKLENFSLFGNLTRASEKDSAFLLGNISEETYNNEDADWTKSLIRFKQEERSLKRIEITQDLVFYLSIVGEDSGGTGGSILWDASLFLSRWIALRPQLLLGKKVIELGAGLGLPGLVAGVYAKEVCISDVVTEVLDNLNENIIRNYPSLDSTTDLSKSGKRVYSLRLDWFDFIPKSKKDVPMNVPKEFHMKYDVALISDVVYSTEVVAALVATIEATGCTICLVSMPTARLGAREFIKSMKEKFSVERETLEKGILREKKEAEILDTYLYHFRRK